MKRWISVGLCLACLVSLLSFRAWGTDTGFAPYEDANGIRQYCACGNCFVADAIGTVRYVNGKDGCDNHKDAQGNITDGCDGTILSWQSWTSQNSLPTDSTGNYYLTKSVQLTGVNSIAADMAIALDLNGYTIHGAENCRVYEVGDVGASLILTDTAGGGAIIARGADADTMGIWVRYGSFTMYGGTVDASQAQADKGAAVGVSTTYDNDLGLWHMEVLDDAGTVTLTTPEGKYLSRSKSSSNVSVSNTKTNWSIAKDAEGYYTLTNTNGDSRYLSYNGTGFKSYAAASSSRFIQFKMIPHAEAATHDGKYLLVAVAGDQYYVVGNSISGGVGAATQVTVANGTVVENDAPYWNLTHAEDAGMVTLTTPDGKYLGRTASSSNVGLKENATQWKLEQGVDGYYTLLNENGDSRYLSYNGSGFKAYAAASATRFIKFMLIPVMPSPETGDYRMVAKTNKGYFAVGNTAQNGVAEANVAVFEKGIPMAQDAMTYYGRFSMFGGTVIGGQAQSNGGSIAIDAGSVMNMYGGTVRGGSAKAGGNIHNAGALSIYGGTVSGGSATMGGNIHNTGSLQITEDATEQEESLYTRQELEDTLAATAWAYYLKEDKLQYCSQEITSGLSKYTGGNYRLTEDAAPEYGTSDTTIYSVCSDFVYKVYYEALGHRLFGAENYLGATTSDFWLKSEDVALFRWINTTYQLDETDIRYGVTREKELSTQQTRAFMSDWAKNLRPGDVIVFTGHAFLYVGNGYVIDCRGEKYNEATGLDAVEGNGSVHYLHTVEGVFLDGTDPVTKSYVIQENGGKDWLVVFRPLDAFVKQTSRDAGEDSMDMDAIVHKTGKFAVTQSRQMYPAMEIDRTVDITPYGTVTTGETLNYTVAITNGSNDPDYVTYRKATEPGYTPASYQALTVTERIPKGTQLVTGSISHGGVCANGVITWVVNIAPGEELCLTYGVQVSASMGSTVVSGGGFVAGIPSNTISNRVGGAKLSNEKLAGLTQLAQTPTDQWRQTYNISKLASDTAFADRVYQKAMGIGLDLPSVEQILANLFIFQTVNNPSCSDRYPDGASANLFVRNEVVADQYQSVNQMLVPGYLGGQRYYSAQRGTTINEFSFDYLAPGDVLISAEVKSTGVISGTEVMVYVGNGTLLMLNSQKELAVLQASSMNNADLAYAKLWNMLSQSIFCVLRPSQAYADINTLAYDTAKEPTYGKEPTVTVQESAGLSQENVAALQALTASGWTMENTLFTQEVYGKIGMDISPVTQSFTVGDLLKTELFFDADNVQGKPYHYDILATPAKSNQALAAMLMPALRGGPDMLGYENNKILLADLQVGDVLNLINREKSRYWICIYQGDGKFLTCEGGTSTYQIYTLDDSGFAQFLTQNPKTSQAWECYFVLRPSNGFANINTAAVEETALGTVALKKATKGVAVPVAKRAEPIQTNNGILICDGTAELGGNIYSTGTVTITGGKITGGSSCFASQSSLRISGSPQICGDVRLEANCSAVLKNSPSIQSLYVDNTGTTLPDVTGLRCEPIPVNAAQPGNFAESGADNSACFLSAEEELGIGYDPISMKLQLIRKCIYVSGQGSDQGDGSQQAPYLTMEKALTAVADQGTIHILDTVSMTTWASHGKSVTITGGRLELNPVSNMFFIGDGVCFTDMTLWLPDPANDGNESSDYFYLFCGGNKTCISQDVTVIHGAEDGSYDGINSRIFGGSNVAVDSTDLTVLAGRWGWIYGGSYKDHVSGDVHLTVGGDVNKDVDYVSHDYHDSYLVIGGSAMGNIGGTVYMNITGGNGYTTVHGGSNGTCSIGAVQMRITGGEGMAIYGGGFNGVNTIGQVTVNYEGGSFEQVFGGCLSKNLVGNVDVWLTGGKISRRVYGGCYNNTSGLSFSTDHLVEGTVNLYIGSGVDISLDYNDNDVSIYGHSRHKATSADAEYSRIIFTDQQAYSKYGNQLGAKDSIMATMFMRNVTVADYVCYMGWSADEDADRISVGAVELEDHVSNALDLPVQTATLTLDAPPYIYTGTAVTPASVIYSDNWNSGELTLTYENNTAAGTATVTASVGEYSVSKTFQIQQYVASVTKEGVTTCYTTLQEAVDNAQGSYVKLLADSNEQVTVTGDLYLDLNGHSLAQLTVSGVLYGMDSSTDGYSDAQLGQLICDGTVASDWVAANGNRYIALQTPEGSYSFHRIYVGITKLSLATATTGFGYKAEFYADDTVKALFDTMGYSLWLTEDLVIDRSVDSFRNTLTLRLNHIDIANYGSAKIHAKVSLTLTNGMVIESAVASYSMQDMVEIIDTQLDTLRPEQIQAIKEMLSGFDLDWNIPNLKNN